MSGRSGRGRMGRLLIRCLCRAARLVLRRLRMAGRMVGIRDMMEDRAGMDAAVTDAGMGAGGIDGRAKALDEQTRRAGADPSAALGMTVWWG